MEEDNMRRPPANDAQYIALLSGDAWLEIGQLPDAMTRGIWERERERCPLCSACTKPASVRIEKEHFSPFRTQKSQRCLSLDFYLHRAGQQEVVSVRPHLFPLVEQNI